MGARGPLYQADAWRPRRRIPKNTRINAPRGSWAWPGRPLVNPSNRGIGRGGSYEHVFESDVFDPDGIPRRIVARFTKLGGRLLRVSIVLEERRDGREGHVIRFDNAHGRFHRHTPGWPEPGSIDAYLDDVESRFRVRFALEEIVLRYTEYEAAVFAKDP